MEHPARSPQAKLRRRAAPWIRAAVAAVVVTLAHVAVLLGLASGPAELKPPVEPAVLALSVSEGLASPAASSGPSAALEPASAAPAVAGSPVDTSSAEAATEVRTDAAPQKVEGAPGSAASTAADCRVVEAVQTALAADPRAPAALQNIPPAAKSITHALVLWSGRWLASESIGGEPVLDPLREIIVESLANVPATCRNEVVVGPRFVILNEPDGATVIALGSGNWRWVDLMAAGARDSE